MIEKECLILGTNTSLKIYFNGKLINVKSFEDYIKYYTDEYFYESNKDKSWSIGIAYTQLMDFQRISFVNTTDTWNGGTHVDYVLNQIISKMREFF